MTQDLTRAQEAARALQARSEAEADAVRVELTSRRQALAALVHQLQQRAASPESDRPESGEPVEAMRG